MEYLLEQTAHVQSSSPTDVCFSGPAAVGGPGTGQGSSAVGLEGPGVEKSGLTVLAGRPTPVFVGSSGGV